MRTSSVALGCHRNGRGHSKSSMAKFTLNVMRKQLPIGQNIKFRCILTNYMQLLALKVARFISLVLLADKCVINAQLKGCFNHTS